MRKNKDKKEPIKIGQVGTIRINARAIGTVLLPASPAGGPNAKTVEIDTLFLNTALDGDGVKILLHPLGTKQTELKGEVVEVLKRKREEFVGTLQREDGVYFVVTDDKRMYTDIIILPHEIGQAKEKDKVLVKIVRWTDPKRDPLGQILRVIGPAGQHETEMQSIVLEKGFRPEFSAEVEREAKVAKNHALANLAEEAAKRRDFRTITTFTIDPIDAKDFDDALSFQKINDNTYEVGVHIADVSFFIRPHTKLDEEARDRATSIYLVDRTIPMLPEVLSNDMCSLREGEDRFAFSAVFTMDKNGRVLKEWFGKTIIRSNKRFSYEEVQWILDNKQGLFYEELQILNQLAYKLREKKIEEGALIFEDEEVKFELDENGRPIRVYKKERTDSHKLIEDFMLLANKKVAEYVSRLNRGQDRTFVYRVHEVPDMEKIISLKEFLDPLGYGLKLSGQKISSVEINRMLARSIGSPEESMIHRATVRAMQKAIYSTKNIGHFGLAFPHYTHFTSPIRRYPDLMVHRLLEIYLAGKRPSAELLAEYSELAIHCSEQERLAAEAERDSVKYKQVEYMGDKIGQTYNGIISGLTDWGIYVEELETKAEGLVRLSDLKDDYYHFDEKRFAMVGERTKKRYRLGDLVKIKVKKADLSRKIIDYILV